MAQVSVTLVRADTNQEFDVELPDDAPIAELLPALVKELGLPLTGPDGNQVAYELSNKRTGQELKEAQTLGTAATKTGDVLLLTSTFVAGGKHCRPPKAAKPLGFKFRYAVNGNNLPPQLTNLGGIHEGTAIIPPEHAIDVLRVMNLLLWGKPLDEPLPPDQRAEIEAQVASIPKA